MSSILLKFLERRGRCRRPLTRDLRFLSLSRFRTFKSAAFKSWVSGATSKPHNGGGGGDSYTRVGSQWIRELSLSLLELEASLYRAHIYPNSRWCRFRVHLLQFTSQSLRSSSESWLKAGCDNPIIRKGAHEETPPHKVILGLALYVVCFTYLAAAVEVGHAGMQN